VSRDPDECVDPSAHLDLDHTRGRGTTHDPRVARRRKETTMLPDAHIAIYRAEQTARERAHLRYADRPARTRSTLSDFIRSLTSRHRSGAASGSHIRGVRRAH
jgi:hypothetical protein